MESRRRTPRWMGRAKPSVGKERTLTIALFNEVETIIDYEGIEHLLFAMGKRIPLDIAVAVLPHLGDNVVTVVAPLHVVTNDITIGLGFDTISGKAEFVKWVLSIDVLIGMHETGAESIVAGLPHAVYQGGHSGIDALTVGLAGTMPGVVVRNHTIGVWLGTSDPCHA